MVLDGKLSVAGIVEENGFVGSGFFVHEEVSTNSVVCIWFREV